MSIGHTLPKQLVVILSVWLLMTGMAVLDVMDVSDAPAHPWVTWEQAIDPELEGLDDEASAMALASLLPVSVNRAVFRSPLLCAYSRLPLDMRAIRPLFQQLTQYRI